MRRPSQDYARSVEGFAEVAANVQDVAQETAATPAAKPPAERQQQTEQFRPKETTSATLRPEEHESRRNLQECRREECKRWSGSRQTADNGAVRIPTRGSRRSASRHRDRVRT